MREPRILKIASKYRRCMAPAYLLCPQVPLFVCAVGVPPRWVVDKLHTVGAPPRHSTQKLGL